MAPMWLMLHGQRSICCCQRIHFLYMVLAAYMYTKAKQDLHLQGEIRIYISKLLFTNVSTTAYARSVMLNSVKRHQAWTYVWKVNQEMIYAWNETRHLYIKLSMSTNTIRAAKQEYIGIKS